MPATEVHGKAQYDPKTRTLTINRCFETGQPIVRLYRVDRLVKHEAVPGPAFTLTALNDDGSVFSERQYSGGPARGRAYTVARTETGIECDCADWTFRRANEKGPCKHGAALVAVGLMPGGK